MELIQQYFPELDEHQLQQLQQLGDLYREWNQKINVISRKDIDAVYDHHILHSLAIARFVEFEPDSEILDLGTGGGLPGIPLAILFPDVRFTLIDGTRKKIMVVQEIINALELTNAKALHQRAEETKHKYDFVICRAVASLDKLVAWSFPLIKKKQKHVVPNGLLTLKGGDLRQEIKELGTGHYVDQEEVFDFFPQTSYFKEKYVVYVQHG
jgi:16S rRNA (guanine527-N7)-methyltransferase